MLIKEQIAQKSKNGYLVDFNELNLQLLAKHIHISELHIHRDSTTLLDTTTNYDIHIPRIEIGFGSVWNLYFDRDLKITGIKIYDPKIGINKTNSKGQRSTLSIETGSLYEGISDYLRSFSIQDFEIDNATIRYQKPSNDFSVQVDQIDFLIKNFQLDSASSVSDSSKFLYTDKIELIITDQTFNLGDSIHNISFDEFHISTGTGDVLFKNLSLNPKKGIDIKELDTYYDIDIPEFNFRGLDFGSAYSNNALLLDSVRVLSPTVKVFKSGKEAKLEDKEELNLMKLSTVLFSDIKVQRLYVDKATLFLDLPDKQHLASYRGKEINLRLDNLHIDSTHSSLSDLANIYKYMYLDGNELFAHIIDSSHTVKINHFEYSNKTSSANLAGLAVTPVGRSSDIEINFQIDSLRVLEMATMDELINGNIMAKTLEIVKPITNIDIRNKSMGTGKGLGFLRNINIEELRYIDGNIRLHDGITSLLVNHASASLSKIDYQTADSIGFYFSNLTENAHITLKDLNLSSDKIDLDLHRLDLIDWKTLHAANISMQSKEMDEPFTFGKVSVTEFDLDHFLRNELLAFDTLIIDQPNIAIHPHEKSESDRKKLVHWAHHTEFREVKFTNGMLTHHSPDGKVLAHMYNFDAELSHFHYDSIQDEYFTTIGYRSDSLYMFLPKINHQLTGYELSISIKDSTLDIKQLELISLSDTSSNQINVSSHEFKLRQINFHHLINEKQLHFYTGYVLTPKANIKLYQKAKKPTNLEKDLLKFGSLNVSNGSIHFENHIKNRSLMTDVRHLNLLIANFDLGKDSTIFSAKNYLADVRDLSIRHYGKEDSVNIKSALINTKEGDIKIQNISLNPTSHSSLDIPEIRISGLDPEILAHEKRLVMDSLIIRNPSADLDLRKQPDQQDENTNPGIPSITSKYFLLDHGRFSVTKQGLNHAQPLSIGDIVFAVDDLSIDSTTTMSSLPELLPSSSLSTSQIAITTPDSLYEFRVAGIDYDGETNEFIIHNILLDPLYSRSQFQRHITYQKDWLDLHIDEIRLKNMDQRKMIEEDYLELEEIEIVNLNLDTHRDKRLPIEPDVQRPLPQEMLMNIDQPFFINKVRIKNGFVSHSEFSESGTRPGNIFFRDIDAELKNISNDRNRLALNSIMTFNSRGVMMNTGNFDVTVDFDLLDAGQFFFFQGTLNDMDLTELNRLLEHTAFVRIRDGYNKHVTFNFEANEDYAIGDMKFYYDDLKIRVLNPDDEGNKGHGASIKSFFANTFVVSKKNPHLLFVREGDIFHHRDGSKAIFNYWAKALLSGVVSSIGAKNNKKEIKKLNDDFKAELDRKRSETIIKANRRPIPE